MVAVVLLLVMFFVRWTGHRSAERKAREAASSQQSAQEKSAGSDESGGSNSDPASVKSPTGIADSSAPDPAMASSGATAVPGTGPGITALGLACFVGVMVYFAVLRLQMRA